MKAAFKTRSIKIPLEVEKDRRKIIQGISSLPRQTARGIEVFHSAELNETDIRLAAGDKDIESYYRDLRLHFPIDRNGISRQFPEDGTIPIWIKEIFKRPHEAAFFDVEYTHRHPFVNFDLGNMTSITDIINSVQKTRLAWLQILFVERNLTPYLNDLSEEMSRRFNLFNSPIHRKRNFKDTEGKVHTEDYTVDHPEKNSEFTSNYKRLSSQLHQKSSNRHIVTVVRGVMMPNISLNVDVSESPGAPESLPIGGYESVVGENLRVYYYQNPRCLLDLLLRRIPDVDLAMKRFVHSYHSYVQRENLPFLILTPQELPLFVHLPDPANLSNIQTTRQSAIPQMTIPQKEGIQIGS